jgi:hypothetical protein
MAEQQLRDVFPSGSQDAAASFSAPLERDGVTVTTATRARRRTVTAGSDKPGPRLETSGSHPLGAFVIEKGRVRWRPAVDATRLLTTAELVLGAVLVAHGLARRPSPPRAHVTMGAGGWVSMKGGSVAVRPASRPWGRPRPLVGASGAATRRPVWARLLAAVPLQQLIS